MKRLFSALLLLAVFASIGFSQAAPDPNTTGSVFFGIGAGYNASGYNGAGSQKAGVLLNLGFQPANSNFVSYTTLITQPGKSSGINTLRTGIGYSLKETGNFKLIALADAGATTTNTAILGNLGGGVLLKYDLGGLIKKVKGQGFGVLAGFRIAAITGTSVQPEYMIGLSKKF